MIELELRRILPAPRQNLLRAATRPETISSTYETKVIGMRSKFLLTIIVILMIPNANAICEFDLPSLQFLGTPLDQARCLLRPVLRAAAIGAPLSKLPQVLEDRIGNPVRVNRTHVENFLRQNGIREAEVGGPLDQPLSAAGNVSDRGATARYFVIHDTSTPNYCDQDFPGNINSSENEWNKPEVYANAKDAHLYITRDGKSIAPSGRTFATPWRATKFETKKIGISVKGLFLHVENVQPRRARQSKNGKFWRISADKRICINDQIAPEPGFTDPQLARLALTYVIASVRRGEWLIPAYHAAIDEGLEDPHDDPQRFDLHRWALQLCQLLDNIGERCKDHSN